MKKLRWGILSSAKIGRQYLIPAIQNSLEGEVVAIASRTQESAEQLASKLQIPRAYGSYEALIADPEIDAIYNPLPNHLHVPWSIKAIEAGKHVLCEKPLGLHVADVKNLILVSQQHPTRLVMEAFMYRFHPQWRKVHALVQAGYIGQVRSIHGHFSYNNHDADNIRNSQAMGGGALMDIGCYCISLARLIYDEEPLRVLGQITPYAGYEVDCFTSGLLEFADGNASFTVSTKSEDRQYVEIYGEQGTIIIPRPFNPSIDAPTHILVKRQGVSETIDIAACNQYSLMTDAFAQAVHKHQPAPTPLADALANMTVIDALFLSADQQQWITLAK